MFGDEFTDKQLKRLQQLFTSRLKSLRHEASDHLDRALDVKKLKPSTVDLRYLRTISGDVVWDDSNNIISKVGSFTCPASTGSYSVTGVGFTPALVQFSIGLAASTSYAISGTGAMDANGNQWSAGSVYSEVAPGAESEVSSTSCIILPSDAGAGAFIDAGYVSMDADGFTITFAAVNSAFKIAWTAISQPISVDVNDHGGLTGLGDDDHTQYHNDTRGDARYWQLTTDLATQAELDAHTGDTSAAHAASAISADSTTLVGTGTDVQAVLEELDNGIADHLADTSAAHAASAISISDAANDFTATDVEGALAELQSDAEADATALSDHIADATDAHAGTAITNTPAGNIAATTVQAAINELDSEKATTGSVTTVQSNLDTHIADTSAAHAASSISADSTTLVGTGTTVQAVFEELDNAIVAAETATSNHLADTSAAHAASAISADSTTLVGVGTDVQAVLEELDNGIADHLADATAAHAASAISVDSTTLVGTGTTVQAVFEEMDNDIATLTAASGIPATIVDARGDLIRASAADTVERLALGADGSVLGSDGTDAVWRTKAQRFKVGHFQCPASTGNKAVTGVGFKPGLVEFSVGVPGNTSYAFSADGAMDSSGTQWAHGSFASATLRESEVAATSYCLLVPSDGGSAGDLFVGAVYVSMDSDGFTINFTSVNTAFYIGWKAFA